MTDGPASSHAGRSEAGPDLAVVRPSARLRGEPRLPGDKSISHRALLLALLAPGTSTIRAAGDGEDVRTTAAIVSMLGASVVRLAERGGRVDYRIDSPGREGIAEPEGVLDCRNSGTSLRLTTGIVAGRPIFTILDGDASLRRRPVARVATPLIEMGARIAARRSGTLPPLAVEGSASLRGIVYRVPVPSAQVKSAILFAGLSARGETTVVERVPTRDHTERMLVGRGVRVDRDELPPSEGGGSAARLTGPATPRAVDEVVPADPSAAAFWLVAGSIHPDAEITLRAVGTNPTRRAIIDLLRRMGAAIEEMPHGQPGGGAGGEPIADLVVRSSELRGIDVTPDEVAAAIDEIPVLCLAAARAIGATRIRGAGELRHKESDRIAGIAEGLQALGARITVEGDDIEIEGGARLRGALTDSRDDHRLAMTFAVAGLLADGETAIRSPGSASISYPGFFDELERVRG